MRPGMEELKEENESNHCQPQNPNRTEPARWSGIGGIFVL
jgi:hypothetical protein